MINIEYFFKKINHYKILFYTLIYKYLFYYIFAFIFFYGLFNNKIDLCCGKIYNKFYDYVTFITYINLISLPIITFIILILALINIYIFNKKCFNNNENDYINKLKKINQIEFLIIMINFGIYLLMISVWTEYIDGIKLIRIPILSFIISTLILINIYAINKYFKNNKCIKNAEKIKNFNYCKYLIIMINIEIILLIIFALNNEIISDDFILIFSTIVSGILPFSILEILFYIENKKKILSL